MFQTVVAAISGTVTVGGNVDVGNTVDVQSQGLLLTNQLIPTAGGTLTRVTGIPPWVRVLYLMIGNNGSDDFTVSLTGPTSNLVYADNLPAGFDSPVIQAIPFAGLLDSSLDISVVNPSHAGSTRLILVAMPDAGISPVQNIPAEALTVAGIEQAPDQISAATAGLTANTALTIIPAPPSSQVIRLWHLQANNATGSSTILSFQDTFGGRLLADNVANAGDMQMPFYGLPIIGPGAGVQIVSSVAGSVRYTALYTLTAPPF